jgi:hypothetical protein
VVESALSRQPREAGQHQRHQQDEDDPRDGSVGRDQLEDKNSEEENAGSDCKSPDIGRRLERLLGGRANPKSAECLPMPQLCWYPDARICVDI